VILIDEAKQSGARLFVACDALDITYRTYRRWKGGNIYDRRKGAPKHVANKLSDAERQSIVDTACNEEFRSMTPHEIVPTLAERGTYIGSERTFYRVLKSKNLLHHRSNCAPSQKKSKPPELVATGPGQVLSWDITYLRTFVAGIFLYAYLVVDIYSRKIVGWEISDIESEVVSSRLFARMGRDMDLRNAHVHSDRGNPMKGGSILAKLYELGVIPSFSRPRVSDDNPFSESLFKTVKYHRTYPRRFDTIEHARDWFAGFIDWYNTEHLHSGIGYVTPEARHAGKADKIFAKRNKTYALAYEQHPERWSRKPKNWSIPSAVYLNPSDETKKMNTKRKAA